MIDWGDWSMNSTFDVDKLKTEHLISDEYIQSVENTLGNNIAEFYNHYIITHYCKLQELEESLTNNVFRKMLDMKEVNSFKSRVKDPYHFVAKLVRKVITKNDYRNVNLENYHLFFDDLLGFRLILLYQEDWFTVQNALFEHFDFDPQRLFKKGENVGSVYSGNKPVVVSMPEIKIRAGDDESVYFDKCSELSEKPFVINRGKYYRSIHYSVYLEGYLFEVQVRSVFDEAWGEVDHDVLYPKFLKNSELVGYSKMLNRVTGLGNEMSSFFRVLGQNTAPTTEPTLDTTPDELQLVHTEHNARVNHENPILEKHLKTVDQIISYILEE